MPTTNQHGPGTREEYESEHERLLTEKCDRVLLSIKPVTEQDAKSFIIECNSRDDVSADVVEHFAEEVRRLK